MKNPDLKKKIVFVISLEKYLNNYIYTEALSEIEKHFQITYLVRSELKTDKSFLLNRRVIYFDFEQSLRDKHSKIFGLLAWKNIDLSKSFRFRIFRGKPVRKSRLIISQYGDGIERFTTRISQLYNRISIEFRLIWHKSTISSCKDLKKLIGEINPDLAVAPNNAHDPIGSELVRICKKKNILTLFLIDNWDNLSSKSLFWPNPDFITVWGQQTFEHAVNIHKFKSQKVFLIGTPRFDYYFQIRTKVSKATFDFPYILFVGTYLKFDELQVLEKMNEILHRNKEFDNSKIVYRPHPEQNQTEELLNLKLDKVVLDPKINLLVEEHDNKAIPLSISYFPNLISNAQFVTGGLTSMLIESTIFYKRFLGLIHDDGQKYLSPKAIFENYTHFEGIEKLPNIDLCRDLDDLENKMLKTLADSQHMDHQLIDRKRQYYYFQDERTYGKRLEDVVVKIVGN